MKAIFRFLMLSGMIHFITSAQASEERQDSASVPGLAAQPMGGSMALENDKEVRTRLSLLWTVVSLNMIGADVLSTFIPGKQEEVVDYAGGEKNVKYFLLGGAVVYEIPISMIFLSRVMPRNSGRWVNTGAAALSAVTILGAGGTEPHYLFAAGAEILALSYLVYSALNWPDPGKAVESKHSLGFSADPERPGLTYAYRF